MRAILVLLAVVVLIGAALLYTGMISLPVQREGSISVQTPKVGVETGRIRLGTEQHTVTTPTIEVQRANDPNANAQ